MPRRLTNLLLLLLVWCSLASGVLGWLLVGDPVLVAYDVHRLAGLGVVVMLFWKYAIVQGSLRRRWRARRADWTVLPGIAAAGVLLISLGVAIAWTTDLVRLDTLGGYSPLNLHILLALGLSPLLLWHLRRRWEGTPPPREVARRRSALRMLALVGATAVAWQIAERLAAGLAPVGPRQPSGSKHAGSFSANAYPETIWLFDQVPALDAETWQLDISGRVAEPATLTYADVAVMPPREETVVLDCTGGWWSEQVWRGASLAELLAPCGVDPRARFAEVVSVTGHRWTFSLSELTSGVILATHVGGEPLSAGHGFPARLVVPGRRGFQWVKWVREVRVL